MAILKFWLNAFIPKNVPGYTQTLTKGPHAGKTAIPLPGVARLWPGNTLKDWNAGYLTDQRGFDPAIGASCRMQSIAEIDTAAMTLVSAMHRSSGTTEVNLDSGVQTGFAVANMSRCSFTQIGGAAPVPGVFRPTPPPPSNPPRSSSAGSSSMPKMVKISLVGQAGDPLVGMAADIDYVGTLTISEAAGSILVSFDGKIDDFPAYDCYAQCNGVTKTLFTDSPPPGKTVADLLGPAKRPKSGSVRFP